MWGRKRLCLLLLCALTTTFSLARAAELEPKVDHPQDDAKTETIATPDIFSDDSARYGRTIECSPSKDALSLQDYVQPPQFFYDTSDSVKLVKIIANGCLFLIPRNYLEYATTHRGKVGFGIFTFFPDFKGATSENVDRYDFKNRSKVTSYVEIHSLSSYLTSSYLQSNKKFIDDIRKYPVKQYDYGLIRVMYPWEPVTDKYVYATFIHPDPVAENSLVLHCSEVDLQLCSVEIDAAPGVPVEYQYPINLLPHWQEINSHVVSLLNQFRKESIR